MWFFNFLRIRSACKKLDLTDVCYVGDAHVCVFVDGVLETLVYTKVCSLCKTPVRVGVDDYDGHAALYCWKCKKNLSATQVDLQKKDTLKIMYTS